MATTVVFIGVSKHVDAALHTGRTMDEVGFPFCVERGAQLYGLVIGGAVVSASPALNQQFRNAVGRHTVLSVVLSPLQQSCL